MTKGLAIVGYGKMGKLVERWRPPSISKFAHASPRTTMPTPQVSPAKLCSNRRRRRIHHPGVGAG